MKWHGGLIVTVALILVTGSAFALAQDGSATPAKTKPDAPKPAADAPAKPKPVPLAVEKLYDVPPLASVQWIGPPVDIDALYGQAVIMVFVESWCPTCNEWAPTISRQVQAAAKKGPVTLIYLGVDMNKRQMQAYAKSKGLEGETLGVVSKQFVQLCGFKSSLWSTLIVGGDAGHRLTGMFGTYITGTKMQSFLASRLPALYEDRAPLVAKPISAALKRVDQMTRLGRYGAAIGALKKMGDKGAATMKKVLDRGKTMYEAARSYETAEPFLAYRLATAVAREFKSTDFGPDAKKLARKLKNSAQVRREISADKALVKIEQIAAKKPDSPTIGALLGQVGSKYPKCRGGRIARRTLGLEVERGGIPKATKR
jgi:thiol-disulfide isomerase/thioredoxin